MTDRQIVRIDGIKWWVYKSAAGARTTQPLCPDHDLRMKPAPDLIRRNGRYEHDSTYNAKKLRCAEGDHDIVIPRKYSDEEQYIIDRIDAKVFKGMRVVDLDGELTPISKEKLKSEDGKYFVTSQLMQSQRGLQLVVYAGEKGSSKKTQIFIEPEIKRLAFDQKDLNPTEVFVEMKAIFFDGTSHEVKGKNND